MSEDWKAGLVRIIRPNGSTAGTGFVLSEDGLAVTCSHVIQDYRSQGSGEPKPEGVNIVFQCNGATRNAAVDPLLWRRADAEDVAFFKVEGTLPEGVKALPLGGSKESRKHHVFTFGFPEVNSKAGIAADGHVVGETAVRNFRVLQISSAQITPGFSGAPIWDEASRRVIGMVTMIAEPDEHGRLHETAFITPSETLRVILPSLQLEDVCPYRGLNVFTEAHAEFFFGRERIVAKIADKLRRDPKFLAIFGPSGSGKSSLIQAAVIPRLRKGQMVGFDHCGIICTRPGHGNLFTAPFVREWLSQHSEQKRLVAIVDQFESMIANYPEPLRKEAVHQLAVLLEEDLPVTLLLVMRDDFYSSFAKEAPALLERVERGSVVNVSPTLGLDELTAIVREPARVVGLDFESGLIDAILKDVVGPGLGCEQEGQCGPSTALPLLEFALTELWERRKDGLLTHDAFHSLGGVTGALAQWANTTFDSIDKQLQPLVRRMFADLVHLGAENQGLPDSRRRMRVVELCRSYDEREVIQWLVEQLVDARLLVTARDELTSEETVEIIHDALLREWDTLRAWLNQDREFLLWRQRLRQALAEWEHSAQDEGALLRTARLVEAERWLGERIEDLSPDDTAFIRMSKALKDREEQAREHERERLQRAYERAEQQRQVAMARQLAAQAESLIVYQPTLLDRSLLLALESMQRFPCSEADHALRRGLDLLPRRLAYMDHKEWVFAIDFSHDGRYLATGCRDGTARIWEVAGGDEIARFTHRAIVMDVAFSPDGRYLAAAASEGCTASVWEVSTRREVARMAHQHVVASVVFSVDGKYLATGSWDGSARIWEPTSGREVSRVLHKGEVVGVQFSTNGEYLVTASTDRTARLWKIADGQEVACMSHDGMVHSVALSNSGEYVATSGSDCTVRTWKATGQEVSRMNHEGEVRSVVFSPCEEYVASASNDRTARIWQVANGREVTRMTHEDRVHRVRFSPEGRYLATASGEYMARVWEVTTGQEVGRMAHRARVYAVGFSPDGKTLSTGSEDGAARLWAITGNQNYILHGNDVTGVSFSPDSRYLLTVCGDPTARVWDLTTRTEVVSVSPGATVYAAVFSPDGRYLATSSKDGTARLWEVSNGREVARMCHEAEVWDVGFSPEGKYLATASFDNTARIWESATGLEVCRLTHESSVRSVDFSLDGRYLLTQSQLARRWEVETGREVTCTDLVTPDSAFSPDGRYVATASQDGEIWLWEANQRHEILRVSPDEHARLAFSPDGRYLAIATWNESAIHVWDVENGRERTLVNHEGGIYVATFTPESHYLVSASEDYTARVWDLASGLEIARVTHAARVRALACSLDGRYLATGSDDHTAGVWLWRPHDLTSEAASRLTRNLTDDEWRQYLADEPYHKTCESLP